MQLFFRDNFFNAGETEILNEQDAQIGYLNLKSAFGSSIEVYDEKESLVCEGRFPAFSNKWEITDPGGQVLGVLRHRFAFFSKKFTYETIGGGVYDIVAPAFSNEYEILGETGEVVAQFFQVNRWFRSGAFQLSNLSEELNSYELVAVIMGIHETIERQNRTPATT